MIKILIENKINQLVEEFFEEYDGGGNLLVIDDDEDIDVDELFMDIEPHESISSIYREDDRIFIEINEYDKVVYMWYYNNQRVIKRVID